MNIGGWLALNDEDLFEEARNLVVVYEGLHTYGGLAGRDMEAMARGIEESVQDDHIRARIGQVEYLGELLIDWGIPIVLPDRRARGLPRREARSTRRCRRTSSPRRRWPPSCTWTRGIRAMERGIVCAGRDPQTGEHRYPKLELVRLTIPRRVYTQAHMDVTAESVAAVYDAREGAAASGWSTSRSTCASSRRGLRGSSGPAASYTDCAKLTNCAILHSANSSDSYLFV